MRIYSRVATAVLIAAAAGATAYAQARQPLQEAKDVICEFVLMSASDWGRDGTATAVVKPATLKLGYTNVNTDDGSADVVGTTSASSATAELPIITRFHNGYLHFMQVGIAGFLFTTTVFDQVGRPGKLKAVHSRHEWQAFALPGYTARPEQYYGECEVK